MRMLVVFIAMIALTPLHAAEIDIAFTDDRVAVDTG